MKRILSILTLLLIAFSGIVLAQEAILGESSVESTRVSEAREIDVPAVEIVDTPVAIESEPVPIEVAVDESDVTIESIAIEDTPIGSDGVVVEVTPVTPDTPTEPVAPIGPIEVPSDGIVVVEGPIVLPCDALLHEGTLTINPCHRPLHTTVLTSGPVDAIPCAKIKSGNVDCTTPGDGGDDGSGDTGTGTTPDSSSSPSSGSSGNGGLFFFSPIWYHPPAPTAPAAPIPAVGTLETSTPEPTATLSNDGPDPALIGLADGRNQVVEVPTANPVNSPATGLFTGSNAPLIGVGILILIGAALYVRRKK